MLITTFFVALGVIALFLIIAFILATIVHRIVSKRHRNEAGHATASAPTQAPAPATLQKRYHIDRLPTPSPIPSDEELGIVRVSRAEIRIRPCPHAHMPRAVAFDVYGLSIKTGTMPRCPSCAQALLEALFERCAACGKGIAVGSLICISWIGAERPYTHVECAETQSLLCGKWGQGRLVPLEQLELDITVPPGTATLMQFNDLEMQTAIEQSDQTSDDANGSDTGSKPNAN